MKVTVFTNYNYAINNTTYDKKLEIDIIPCCDQMYNAFDDSDMFLIFNDRWYHCLGSPCGCLFFRIPLNFCGFCGEKIAFPTIEGA